MKVYLKSGRVVKVSKFDGNMMIDTIFNEKSSDVTHLKLRNDKVSYCLFKISDIEAIK